MKKKLFKISELPGTFLEAHVERDCDAVACPKCNGYADSVGSTEDEINSDLNCGRSYACCCMAFVCRICKTRILAHALAPDVE